MILRIKELKSNGGFILFNSMYLFIPGLVGLIFFYFTKIDKKNVDYFYFYFLQFVVGNFLALTVLGLFVWGKKLTNLQEGISFFNSNFLLIGIMINILGILWMNIKGINICKGEMKQQFTLKGTFFIGISFIMLFIGLFSALGSLWVKENFGSVTPDQIIYHIIAPLEGTNEDFIWSFIDEVIMYAIIIDICIIIAVDNPLKAVFSQNEINHKILLIEASPLVKQLKIVPIILFCVISIGFGFVTIDARSFYDYLTSSSFFIADNYVSPTKKTIIFPEKKRNLIYIFVESLETTFISQELGGQMTENYIKPLTDLAETGVYFTNSDKMFGGATVLPGTGWTIAGMVAQTAGLPLKVNVDGNEYGQSEGASFLPGVTSLGDILEAQGYNQMIMVGSDIAFGGREAYLTQHGNYEIFDYNTAKERELIPQDYKEWWGFEDSKLFEFAKSEISKKADEPEPFNMTLLTVNTHHVDGYLEKGAPEPFDKQYSNVYAYTAQQLADFVGWIEKQDFYEDTSVIISGDHLSMDPKYFQSFDISETDRKVFNLFINSKQTPVKQEREYTTMDLFPSTLATLGATIEGERLGLGTNLFSSKDTILEEFGYDRTREQLMQASDFYNINLLKESGIAEISDSSELRTISQDKVK